MKIGIISNSDNLIALTSTLAFQKMQVYLFYSSSPDAYTNQMVKAFASHLRLSITYDKGNGEELYHWISTNNLDICFVNGYSHLIKTSRIPQKTQLFNIHYGSLPGYRGPSPLFWQLKFGEPKIGITIHRVNDNFDAGPIVWMKGIDNLPHYDSRIASLACNQYCIEGVAFILNMIANNLQLPEIKQEEKLKAYHKKPVIEDVSILWDQMDASTIVNLVRACMPWNKGAMTSISNREIKILDAAATNRTTNASPGTIISNEDNVLISCFKGGVIEVSMFFLEETFVSSRNTKHLGINVGQRFITMPFSQVCSQ